MRCLAVVENDSVRLQSRHLLDLTAQFPEMAVNEGCCRDFTSTQPQPPENTWKLGLEPDATVPNIHELRATYAGLPDGRLFELAVREVADLTPEAARIVVCVCWGACEHNR